MITAQPQVSAPLAAPVVARKSSVSLIGACIAIAVVLGIFFRFYHIERKVYWEDETYTSLHVLGITEAEVVARAATYVDAASLRAVVQPSTKLTTSVGDTVHALATEDPQHPPLYYVAGHLWVQLFGSSVAVLRTLSAVIGVAALPAMYWLGIELFGSAVAAWIGVGLLAISPVAVLFSQEAREYALWSLAVIVMSAAFLRGLRRMSVSAWALYAVSAAASLYVFPISAALIVGNLVVAVALAFRRGEPAALLRPVLATAAGVAAFAPWLAIELFGFHKIDHAMGLTSVYHSSKLEVVRQFAALFKLNFLDVNASPGARGSLVTLGVALLVAYAFWHLIRRAPQFTWIFIVTITVCAAAPFVLPDLVMGQHFTANPRYFMPLYVGVDLALVYLFAANIRPSHSRRMQRRAWALSFTAIVLARAASCAVSANAETWWSKFNEQSIEIARAINATPHPLLISTEYMERSLSLSTYLDPKVALQLRPRCYLCSTDAPAHFDLRALAGKFSDVFALGPSAALSHDVQTALAGAKSNTTYRCIDDALEPQNRCVTAALHLWPT